MKLFFDKLKTLPVFFWHLSVWKKILIFIILGIIWFGYKNISGNKSSKVQYQTIQAEKSTLVVAVSGSGQVASTNSVEVSTQASGVVKNVYVKDGDNVKSSDPIVELDLDLIGTQRYQQALSSYQSAKNSLDLAKANLYTSQSTMLNDWKDYVDIATNNDYENEDGTPNTEHRERVEFVTEQNTWLSSEAKYKIQQQAINQAQTSLSSSWSSLQQASPIIYAPISGKISGMSLQKGNVIGSSSTTSGSASSVKIANVETEGLPSISVDLSEIDVPKVTIGDKATVTLDAISDKTYTGSVVSIDTVGSVNSGVSVYPAVVRLDTQSPEILPNMSASANIITNTKSDVIIVPVSAVVTQNGSSVVRVMRNGKMTEVPVEVGLSSDSQTEIISGIAEGDTVVTSIVQTSSSTTSSSTSSPFGMFGGSRSGGGQVRMIR